MIAFVFSKSRDPRGYLRKVTDLFRGIVRLKHVLIPRYSVTFSLSETYHGHVVSLKSADRNFREFNPFIWETEVETGGCMIRYEIDEETPYLNGHNAQDKEDNQDPESFRPSAAGIVHLKTHNNQL